MGNQIHEDSINPSRSLLSRGLAEVERAQALQFVFRPLISSFPKKPDICATEWRLWLFNVVVEVFLFGVASRHAKQKSRGQSGAHHGCQQRTRQSHRAGVGWRRRAA